MTTNISIPSTLHEKAVVKAKLRYLTFSGYIQDLIKRDLRLDGSDSAKMEVETKPHSHDPEPAQPPTIYDSANTDLP